MHIEPLKQTQEKQTIMSIPLFQALSVTSHIISHKLKRQKRYPLVLMLEPLFRCNLACEGCGKIQYPEEILRKYLTPEQCFNAVEECSAPVVSIAGGEPLLHPQIDEIISGLKKRRKYMYLCTNGIVLKENLSQFQPSQYLTLSVHLDGLKQDHDRSVSRPGMYDRAVDAIKEALNRGFNVTTNTTLYSNADAQRVREFFDEMTALGVQSMTISPGFCYDTAKEQGNFLTRERTQELFRDILSPLKKSWKFNQSPLYLEFLKGRRDYECTPWGNPTYNIWGWQVPCYLINDSYAASFKELINEVQWEKYGRSSGNSKCIHCMMHSGYEPSAVNDTFSSFSALVETALILAGARVESI
jgi:hopanoid biosynthesis associated radical SAM protein HpnH